MVNNVKYLKFRLKQMLRYKNLINLLRSRQITYSNTASLYLLPLPTTSSSPVLSYAGYRLNGI